MVDSITSEFTESAQGTAAATALEMKNLVASVYKQSVSDTLFGWWDASLNLQQQDMKKLYDYYGPRNSVDVAIGDRQVQHNFEVRMRNHGNGNYSMALYEKGELAGTAKTPELNLSPDQIYEQNPLREPNLPTMILGVRG